MTSFYTELAEALSDGQPFALALITQAKGSSPQKKGAKALFFADGRMKGTLGGGCLEAEVHVRARRALRTGTPARFEMVLDDDFGWDDGLICGGSVCGLILPQAAAAADLWRKLAQREEILTWGVKQDFSIALTTDPKESEWLYLETASPPCALWMAGSGHIAQAVAPLARQLDFEVTAFDDRPQFANPQYFPADTRFRVGNWGELLAESLPLRPAFGVIVTRGHQHDALVLRDWIHKPFAFLGMIGSVRKRQIIYEQFVREGIATAEQLERVACPVGLPIKAITVHEIAVSIMAQCVQKRAELVPVAKAK